MAKRSTNRRSQSTPAQVTRTQAVWGLLVMAMTAVGGGLWLLDRSGAAPRLDGLALASIVTTDEPPSIDQVFRTTRNPIERSRWKAIVIHHSGSPSGSPETLAARSADSSYHFIIGNGHGMDDGALYVDYRWLQQVPAHHVRGANAAWYDQNAISICVVGDGQHGEFSHQQIDRLVDLVHALSRRLDIRTENVLLSSDVSGELSPGQFFPGAEFHERLASMGR